MATMSRAITMTVRCKAFAGQPVREHRVRVEDGEVRVWDRVAGYYTACHSLSPRTIARIRKLATVTQ